VIAYIDASVVLRVILSQPGALREGDAIETPVTSAITRLECLRTIDRLRLNESLTDDDVARRRELVYERFEKCQVVEIDPDILERACAPLPVMLRALDAIHLVSAMVWHELERRPLAFATHDRQLARAARSVGFTVLGA
jgi:predicted nucleic acid-binding protein